MPDVYSRRYLNDLYRQAGFKDTDSRMLRKILKGFSNYAGCYPVKEIWEYIEKREPGRFTRNQFIEFLKVARYEDEGYVLLSYNDFHGRSDFSDPIRSEIVNLTILSKPGAQSFDCDRYDQIKSTMSWLLSIPDPSFLPIEFYADEQAVPASEPRDRLIGLLAFAVFKSIDIAAKIVDNMYYQIQRYGDSLNESMKAIGPYWEQVTQVVGDQTAQQCLENFYFSVECYDLRGASLDYYQSWLNDAKIAGAKNENKPLKSIFSNLPFDSDKTIPELRDYLLAEHLKVCPHIPERIKTMYANYFHFTFNSK